MNTTAPPSPEAKRLQTVLERLPNWAQGMVGTEDRIQVLHQKIVGYMNNDPQYEIIDAYDALFEFGMSDLAQSLLLAGQNQLPQAITLMRQACQRLLSSVGLDILFMKPSGRKAVISSLDSIAQDMMAALSTGQLKQVRQFYTVLKDALDNGYGVNTAPQLNDTWRYSAMVLSIVGEYVEQPIDLDKLRLPRDPAWMPLVQQWNTANEDEVQRVLLDACDVHVSRIGLTNKEFDSGKFEFDSPYLAVYPAEILAVLRLRESQGLTAPTLDHPLMKTPYAGITSGADVAQEPDELLEGLLAAARRRDPDIMQAWDQAAN